VDEKTITVSSVFTTIVYWFNVHYADTFKIKLFPEWSLENFNGQGKTIFVFHMSTRNLYVILLKAVKKIIIKDMLYYYIIILTYIFVGLFNTRYGYFLKLIIIGHVIINYELFFSVIFL